MTISSWVKPALSGVIVGAVVWWGVLAAGFGWVSAADATKMADQKAQAAVVAVASPFCVSRFEQQANAVASWQALKKSADSFKSSDYLEKGGWVALPGQKIGSDVVDAVANACAQNLLALKEINGVKLGSS